MSFWDSVISCWLAGVLPLWGLSVVSDAMFSSPSSLSLLSFPSSSAEENCTSLSCSSSYSGIGESGDDFCDDSCDDSDTESL